MILSLVSILLVAGTMALLSAITGEKVNAFSGGHVNVSVIETGGSKDNTDLENPGNSDNNTNSYIGNINEGVTKTVAIKNLDKETYHTVDTYVRVRLVPCFRYNEGSEYAGQLVPVNVNAVAGWSKKPPWPMAHLRITSIIKRPLHRERTLLS